MDTGASTTGTPQYVADGDGARSRKDWGAARLSYSKAVAEDDSLWAIWVQLGHACKESGDYAAAERAYRKALLLNPTEADSHLQFGHLMKITQRYPAALASYAYALSLQPNYLSAKREIEGLWRRGDVPERRQSPTVSRNDMKVFGRQGNPITGPSFLGIGMAKAGTGWLFDQLKMHPDFWLPPVKEFAYLKRTERTLREHAVKQLEQLRRGECLDWANRRPDDGRDLAFLKEAARGIGNPQDLASYGALFRYGEGKLTGDITPGYGSLPSEIISKIGETFPETKLILLARDPIERAWSHISMLARNRLFDRRLLEDLGRFRDFLNTDQRICTSSSVMKTIRNWRNQAPNLKLRIFLFDDIISQPTRTLSDILEFLDAKTPMPTTARPWLNAKKPLGKLDLTDQFRSVLVNHFEGELNECASTLGGAASEWPSRYRNANKKPRQLC